MKKMLPWLLTSLLSIALIAIIFFIVTDHFQKSELDLNGEKQVDIQTLSADQRVKVTSVLENVTRNLLDQEYIVRVSFAFQLDSEKTKDDFDKILNIEIKPIVNRILADMTAEQLSGSQGQDLLKTQLLNQVTPVLPRGKLVKVEITDFIIQ